MEVTILADGSVKSSLARSGGFIASVALVGALMTTAGDSAGASPAQMTGEISCKAVNTPVRLVKGSPKAYNLWAELCIPDHLESDTLQVLTPGGTYNHSYWDFPYQARRYSYTRYMNAQGYATLNTDRMSTGNSSHPLSALVNVRTDAFVVHQLVQKVRAGRIGADRFSKVVLVGHSFGSSVSWAEASTYGDVDGLIITGMLHGLNPDGIVDATQALTYPAVLEPQFGDRDLGYVTTRPGTRGNRFFYNRSNTDPQVIEVDERHKDTYTVPEFSTFAPLLLDGTTARIHVPTLVGIGDADTIFCGSLIGADCATANSVVEHEAPYYAPDVELDAYVLKGSGHCMNLHQNAREWFKAAANWMNREFSG